MDTLLVGRVYEVQTTASGRVRLHLAELPLSEAEVAGGELRNADVSVECRAVLVERSTEGALVGRPLEPLRPQNGRLCFDPAAGGVRMRENRLAEGGHNAAVAEAARFGIVNAFFHAAHATAYLNGLLRELGARPVPPLHVVVSAHAGSKLPGYTHRDGDFRQGLLQPLQGGHYRVSTRTKGVPEPLPVRPTGEVHLGPGRRREPFAGKASYLRNASHNPATIYHELGHHLCRHTADFRLNDERPPSEQRNGKTGPEEGVCDYLAASLLGTGRPYGWYRRSRGERRDPALERPGLLEQDADAHAVGARWSTAFWRTRLELQRGELLDTPRAHDRALLHALLSVGSVAGRGDGRGRGERAAERRAPETMLMAYLDALTAAGGPGARDVAARELEGANLAATW